MQVITLIFGNATIEYLNLWRLYDLSRKPGEYVLQVDKDVDSINSEQLLECKGNYGRISAHTMSLSWEFKFEEKSVDEFFQYFFCKVWFISLYLLVVVDFVLHVWGVHLIGWKQVKLKNGKYLRKYSYVKDRAGRDHSLSLETLTNFH